MSKSSSRGRLSPWLMGLATACALCSSYALSWSLRGLWQSRNAELAAQWEHDGRFTLIGLYGTMTMADEASYASRVREASEHWIAYDPFIRENRSLRLWLSDCLQIPLMGLVQRLTGDVNLTWALTAFFCAWLWFVFVYRLASELGASHALAAFCGAFMTCFSYLLTMLWAHNLDFSGGLLRSLLHNAWTVLSFGRTEGVLRLPRPGLSFAMFFLVVLVHVRAAARESRTGLLAAGALGGLLAYFRADIWTTYLAGAWVFAAVWALRRGFSWKPAAAAALASLVSLPWALLNYPPDPDLSARMDMVSGRAFCYPALAYLALAAFVVFKRRDAASLFFASLLAGAAAMLNMQVLTGWNIWSFYWHQLAGIVLFFLAVSFLPEKLRRSEFPWASAAAACVLVAFLQGAGYAALHFPFQGLPRDYDGAFAWLESHAKEEDSVAALTPEVNFLVPVFTRSGTVAAPAAIYLSDLPTVEIARRVLFLLDLYRVDRARFIEDCFAKRPRHDRNMIKRGEGERQDVFGFFFHFAPADKVLAALRAASSMPAGAYSPRYLWVGPLERLYAPAAFLKDLGKEWEKVYESPRVTLYRRK